MNKSGTNKEKVFDTFYKNMQRNKKILKMLSYFQFLKIYGHILMICAHFCMYVSLFKSPPSKVQWGMEFPPLFIGNEARHGSALLLLRWYEWGPVRN